MKKFLVSTADVYGYDSNDVELFRGKTLLDSSVETTLSNTDVRAGIGNQLQYVYYHTAEMNITINEAQFSLEFLALNAGTTPIVGANMFTEETVDITNGAGTVSGIPLALNGSSTGNVYAWITKPDGSIVRASVTAGSSNFDMQQAYSGTACVRYFSNKVSARQITINADMLPSTIRLVMETQLCSSDTTTNKIGKVEIQVPKASMTGQFTLSMAPDSVASTPLSIRALAYEESNGGCDGNHPIYAKIVEYISNSNWYDNVIALAIEGGDFTIKAGGKKTLRAYAIPSDGSAAFLAPISGITFSTTDTTHISITSAGVVTATTATTTPVPVSVTINDKASIDANVFVTVTAA